MNPELAVNTCIDLNLRNGEPYFKFSCIINRYDCTEITEKTSFLCLEDFKYCYEIDSFNFC
jgi:hypothetical protein